MNTMVHAQASCLMYVDFLILRLHRYPGISNNALLMGCGVNRPQNTG